MRSVIPQLSMKRGNYPNHPLFRIAPILDKGFQTVNFDPYELVLAAKIRAGQYAPDLWDCNGESDFHGSGFWCRWCNQEWNRYHDLVGR